MTDELFPANLVAMDSPRLAWIKKNRVITFFSRIKPQCWFAAAPEEGANDRAGWFATELAKNGEQNCGVGNTEDEALKDLAQKLGLRLWNEMGGAGDE